VRPEIRCHNWYKAVYIPYISPKIGIVCLFSEKCALKLKSYQVNQKKNDIRSAFFSFGAEELKEFVEVPRERDRATQKVRDQGHRR